MGKNDDIIDDEEEFLIEDDEGEKPTAIEDDNTELGNSMVQARLQNNSSFDFKKRRSTIQNVKNKIIPLDIDTDMVEMSHLDSATSKKLKLAT